MFTINTHEIIKNRKTIFSTSKNLFPALASKEYFRSVRLKELLMSFCGDESYRKSEEKINRIRWQENEITQSRTIANFIEREGEAVYNKIEEKSNKILREQGFDEEGKPVDWDGELIINPEADLLSDDYVNKMIDDYNEGKEKEKQIELVEIKDNFENPLTSINISIDDVQVKKQKESGREKNAPPKEKREYVKNTIIHIQNSMGIYTINGKSIYSSIKILIAFLLYNNLLKTGALVFYVDGARDLHSAIKAMFKWVPYKVILDWHHLDKKCRVQLSLALRNTKVRNEVLEKVLAYLWLGKVDHAVNVLRQIDKKYIKNEHAIKVLIGYYDRNYSYIPCYALRKKLGLRNSSNVGEKANDLAVSNRQKHNGMSWSKSGSTSLTSVISLKLNNEQFNWLLKGDVDFKLKLKNDKVAA